MLSFIKSARKATKICKHSFAKKGKQMRAKKKLLIAKKKALAKKKKLIEKRFSL